MKKWVAVLVTLLLCLPLGALGETYTAGGYYAIDYPETYTLDDSSYTDESTADNIWLFLLDGEAYLIDASVATVDGYEGFSLTNATDEEKQQYVADTLASFADQNAVLADTLTATSGVPFYVFSMEDSDGPYYYAETILNGTSAYFYCYYDDTTHAPDAALMANLKTVLQTFRPAETGETSHL